MATPHHIIRIQAAAPAKPAWGEPCNGCGLCCLAEPCPLGMLVSRRRHGACAALEWQDTAQQYRCGVLRQPRQHLPPPLRWLPRRWLDRLVRRYIAAGRGCDSDAEAMDAPD